MAVTLHLPSTWAAKEVYDAARPKHELVRAASLVPWVFAADRCFAFSLNCCFQRSLSEIQTALLGSWEGSKGIRT